MSIHKAVAWLILVGLGTVSLMAIVMLIWKMRFLGIDWQEIFEISQQKRILTSVWYSLGVSIIATMLSIGFGTMIVRQILLRPRVSKSITGLNTSFYFPHFVVGLYVYLVFAFVYPYLGEYHKIYGTLEILITYLLKEVPFVVFYLMTTYRKIDFSEVELVRLSGGGAWQIFIHVEFPKIVPQVVELMMILLAFIWTAYEIPSLVGNSFPAFLSVVFYQGYYSTDIGVQVVTMFWMILVSVFLLVLAFALFISVQKYRGFLRKGSMRL